MKKEEKILKAIESLKWRIDSIFSEMEKNKTPNGILQCNGKVEFIPFVEIPIIHLAKIDDTSAFGISHHNHDRHRVYVDGLSYEAAQEIKSFIDAHKFKEK